MTQVVIVPLLWPLGIGIVQLLLRKHLVGQRVIAIISSVVWLGIAIAAWEFAWGGQRLVYNVGNWLAPFGIVLVLDRLAALMLVLSAVLALATVWYAIATQVDAQGKHFHVLWQLQLFGLSGAFLTGDIFNLFVFFEVLLLACYGLMLHGGGRERIQAGFQLVSINLVGSVLFLFAIGALYAGLGTLNIADMAQKIMLLPQAKRGLVAGASLLLVVVFALKAAMFPLYWWLSMTYSNTSAPVAALFAIMTKVGVYALVRVHGTLFAAGAESLAYLHTPWLLGGGLVTLLIAALGMMAVQRLTEQMAYLVLASVGLLLTAVSLHTPEALSAGLYYLIHSTLVGGALFLLADQISQHRAPVGADLKSVFTNHRVWLGSLFFLAAIAIVGLPPLSGFIGKLMILKASLANPYQWVILTIVLVSSLLLLISLVRTGILLFFSPVQPLTQHLKPLNGLANLSVVSLLCMSLLLVVLALPITQATEAIALQLHDVQGYIQAVLTQNPLGMRP